MQLSIIPQIHHLNTNNEAIGDSLPLGQGQNFLPTVIKILCCCLFTPQHVKISISKDSPYTESQQDSTQWIYSFSSFPLISEGRTSVSYCIVTLFFLASNSNPALPNPKLCSISLRNSISKISGLVEETVDTEYN